MVFICISLENFDDDNDLAVNLDTLFELHQDLARYPFTLSLSSRFLLFIHLGAKPEQFQETKEIITGILAVSNKLESLHRFTNNYTSLVFQLQTKIIVNLLHYLHSPVLKIIKIRDIKS